MEMNATEQQTKVNMNKKKKKAMSPCFRRAWRAVKGIFSHSRKDQVEPFPAQSDLDQSDSQPGPSGQTGLISFKPTVLQDPATLLPASCNWEQTLLDPAEPQQGPSGLEPSVLTGPADTTSALAGLEPTAPEESAEHRPEFSMDYNYDEGKFLGAGWYGTVYEGTRKSDGQKVAVKFIPKALQWRYMNIPGYSKPLFREVALNLLLHKPEKCPNIVQMLDWYVEDTQHIIVMEFPEPCVTIEKFIEDGLPSEKVARKLMRQAVNGAKHYIQKNIIHNDLHMGNVLINPETHELKLIDFGNSKLAKGQTEAVSQAVNNLGGLLYLMMHGYTKRVISTECSNLIEQCKSKNPANRPTLDEILNHEWFEQDEDQE